MTDAARIVFISQLGLGGSCWKQVIDRLPDPSAAFIYDRPGTGEAPPRPAPNPPLPYSAFADELAALLDEHGIAGPAVVVGHSIGGLIARAFADRHPQRVAGLAIIDGSIPPLYLHPSTDPKMDGDGPGATAFDTVRGHTEILTAAVPGVPAIVVTRTPGTWDGGTDNIPPWPGVEELWLTSQRLLARDLGCPLVVAEDSGHQLQRDAPELVAYAVQVVHDAVRSNGSVVVDPSRLVNIGGHLDR